MKYKILLFIIIFLGFLLRFYNLGINPPSLDWDEASTGYNAYSILKTGADEYGNKFPLSIRSFGDYKPPVYVYITVLSIAVFGLNEFAVRFPSASMGVLTIIAVYFLTKELLKEVNHTINIGFFTIDIPILSAFFFAVSPWSLQFSRAAFEGNVGLLFFVLGLLFFLKGLKNGKFFIISSLTFAGALYSYHSFRLIIPAVLLVSGFIFWKEMIRQKKFIFISLIIILVLSFPIFLSFFSLGDSSARLIMVTRFNDLNTLNNSIKELQYDQTNNDFLGKIFHNRRIVFAFDILKGYFDHWNFDFLFLHGDGGRQHHAVNMGMLYVWDFLFILLGVFFLLKYLTKKITFLFVIFLCAPLASAITTGTPNPVRAIAMIPFFQIFTATGFVFTTNYLFQKKYLFVKKISFVIIICLFIINVIYYLHQYYVHTPIEYGDFWQYGNKQAIEFAAAHENSYKKIIISYKYDQPYIYYLFYRKIDPLWYQKNWDFNHTGMIERKERVIGKYEFRDISWSKDKNNPNTLIFASPDEVAQGEGNEISEIKYLDGTVAYRVIKT